MPDDDLWTMPSQRQGGLRAVNRSEADEEEWPQEAIMHMNLAGDGTSRYDGSGYGSAL